MTSTDRPAMPAEELIQVLAVRGQTVTIETPHLAQPGLQARVAAMNSCVIGLTRAFFQAGHDSVAFALQLHDEAPMRPCFRMDASWLEPVDQIPMIPDPYTLGSGSYAWLKKVLPDLPRWDQRLPMAIWRGSTTGLPALTTTRMRHLPRQQLCRLSEGYPEFLDARFTSLVQAQSNAAQRAIELDLRQRDLLAPTMLPQHMALHRWIVDIDGNVNSWGLLWKLLSGSCVVRVASPRRQWYHHRLRAWTHFVPVQADLSDLIAVLRWCRSNPQHCSAIAKAGQQLAHSTLKSLDDQYREAVDIYTRRWLT